MALLLRLRALVAAAPLAAVLAPLAIGGCEAGCGEEPVAASPVPIDAPRYRVDVHSDEIALGGEHPLVTLVVFSDYACPPCGRTWEVMRHLVEDYGDDIRVVYRAYTVPGFGRGEQAAEAALAAHAQGKFWDMHWRLFEHGGNFERPTLRAHAEALGLDVPRFMDELDTGAHTSRRLQHRLQAKTLGVVGLPATFANGIYLPGYADEATWHAVLDEEIRRVRDQMAHGVRREDIYGEIMAKASTRQVTAPKGAEALQEKLREQQEDPAPRLQPPASDKRYAVPVDQAPSIGPADAPVVVVTFFDYRCPFCRKAWSLELEKLLSDHGKDVRLVVRNLPLPIHPEAPGAARAALVAAEKGVFPQFASRLLTHEGALGRSDFLRYASELGLAEQTFAAALDEPALSEQIAADEKLAERLGITGTPAFFVNGRYLDGYRPGQVRSMVEEELARAQSLTKEGVPRAELFNRLTADAAGPEEFPNP